MTEVTFEAEISYLTVRVAVEGADGTGASIGTGFFYQAPFNDGKDSSISRLILWEALA
ncbi:hypothetical protein GCM10009113_20940 [Marinobacter szutsaonensis]